MDWMTTLKALAPTVASAFLGPLGGIAVSAVGNMMGVSDATQSKIADAISAGQMTPEQIGNLKELELEYQNNERERGFKYTELEFKDVADARNMAVQTKSVTPTILSYGVLAGGGAMLATVLMGYAKIDTALTGVLMGYVVNEMKQVLQYWFGSSVGSKEKSDTLALVATSK